MPVDSPREQHIYVEVDWLDNGLYAHPNSNLSDNAAGTSRLLQGTLTTQRGRDSARPLGQPMVASGSATVHNADRLLSPEFAGSPIYQLIEPGRAYRIRMAAGAPIAYDAPIPYDDDVLYDGAAILPVVTGFLEESAFDSGLGAHPTTLSCIGSLSRLRGGNPISTPLYQNIRTDQALTYLLDAAGWPAADRVIAVGDTTLDLWWMDAADPFSAALEILASEGAPSHIGESPAGFFVFENRNYRTTAPRSTTSRRTFSDRQTTRVGYDDPIDYDARVAYDAGSELKHGTLSYAPSFRDVRNQATYDIVRRVQQSLQKVWEYGTSLILGASESKLITITLSDPCTGALAPVLATDYSVSAGSLASTPTLESVNAQRLGIRFVAGAGGATILGVTSNGPQLRAQPWTQVSAETVTNNVDASASITKTKGIRSLAISGRREINAAFALTVANAAVNYYQINRPVVEMPFENIDGIHLQAQLTTEVSDRITIISEHLGMLSGAEFWVEQIQHRREPGKLVATLVCERVASAAGGGRWDEGVWDAALWGA
jgi:hypothetical protein